jgi:hypothetical protein
MNHFTILLSVAALVGSAAASMAQTTSPYAGLAASTEAIGATHSALRQTHLKYHLSTVEVLTPAQIQRYAELRGYKGDVQHPHSQH